MLRIFNKSQNYSLSVLWQHPITGFVIKNFAKIFNSSFYTSFSIRHIWETESNWAVAFGSKICNSWECSYGTQLQRWEIHIEKLHLKFCKKKYFFENQKKFTSRKIPDVLLQHLNPVIAICEGNFRGLRILPLNVAAQICVVFEIWRFF